MSDPIIPANIDTFGRTTKDHKTLKVTKKDIGEKVFDPIIARVEAVLDKQIEKMGNKEKIDTILLVGGFAQSKYLQQRLKARYRTRFPVAFPADGTTAVSQGAVIYGQNPNSLLDPGKKYFSQSYSLEVKAKFDESKEDPLDLMVKNSDGTKYTNSRLVYFVKIHDQVESGFNEFEKNVYVEYPNNAVIGKVKNQLQINIQSH